MAANARMDPTVHFSLGFINEPRRIKKGRRMNVQSVIVVIAACVYVIPSVAEFDAHPVVSLLVRKSRASLYIPH
jgi:hypothetical protein